jgi:hypothetical protein
MNYIWRDREREPHGEEDDDISWTTMTSQAMSFVYVTILQIENPAMTMEKRLESKLPHREDDGDVKLFCSRPLLFYSSPPPQVSIPN